MTNSKKTKKTDQVNKIIDRLKKNPNFALVRFDKTSHQTLETLRRDLKKTQSQITVIKNTLLEKAINRLSITDKIYSDFRKKFFPLKETTAIVTLDNQWDQGLKAFNQCAQKEKSLDFKSAIIDAQTYGRDEVKRIAELPGRGELMATIIRSMKSPATNVVYSMKFNLNKLVYVLNQVSQKK
jgi:large subunit ribosomal protein L10